MLCPHMYLVQLNETLFRQLSTSEGARLERSIATRWQPGVLACALAATVYDFSVLFLIRILLRTTALPSPTDTTQVPFLQNGKCRMVPPSYTGTPVTGADESP
jgi:hypothetical protein